MPDWSVTRLPELQRDLCRFLPMRNAELDRMLLIDRGGLEPLLAGNTQINSDFYPVLDLGAEQARFLQRSAAGIVSLGSGVLDYLGPSGLRPTSWDTATASVLALAPPVRHMLRAAELRGAWADRPYPDVAGAPERYLDRTLEQGMAAGAVPANWKSWTADFWAARGARQGGSAPADTGFFRRAAGYAARAGAPEPVRRAIAFGASLAGRDQAGAAAASDILLAEFRAGRQWIPVDDLLDGSVLSFLGTGAVARAREAHDLLRPASTRGPGDLRLALLRAHIERAEAGAGHQP
jgi:hypothetical protein